MFVYKIFRWERHGVSTWCSGGGCRFSIPWEFIARWGKRLHGWLNMGFSIWKVCNTCSKIDFFLDCNRSDKFFKGCLRYAGAFPYKTFGRTRCLSSGPNWCRVWPPDDANRRDSIKTSSCFYTRSSRCGEDVFPPACRPCSVQWWCAEKETLSWEGLSGL